MTVSILVVGAGNRGLSYARYADKSASGAKVVAVAEPIDSRREAVAKEFDIDPKYVFRSWEDAAACDRMADVAIIATQDTMHEEPAVAFSNHGYDILLEKPLASDIESCARIAEAAEKTGVMMAVCHVLRYTPYTVELKRLLDEGVVGDIVSIQHLEPVGPHHQAHSFVRGNWRNEAESSFMLLAKSCHDLDWMNYIMGGGCTRVSSFGSLNHFRKEKAPEGAADRCITCPVESECTYSAKRYYYDALEKGLINWPLNIITQDDPTKEGIERALREGPYGRCVYACDNDVVDHQVVNMEYDNRRSASFTMTAFSNQGDRFTRVFGTEGELVGDGSSIEVRDFMTGKSRTIDANHVNGTIIGGHGGGDGAIVESLIRAVAGKDPSLMSSDVQGAFESHLIVFAAEKARRDGVVIDLADYRREIMSKRDES
jgi:predicted dehydrogenase